MYQFQESPTWGLSGGVMRSPGSCVRTMGKAGRGRAASRYSCRICGVMLRESRSEGEAGDAAPALGTNESKRSDSQRNRQDRGRSGYAAGGETMSTTAHGLASSSKDLFGPGRGSRTVGGERERRAGISHQESHPRIPSFGSTTDIVPRCVARGK